MNPERPSAWIPIDATAGDFYDGGQGYVQPVGINSAIHDDGLFPFAEVDAHGVMEPRCFRFSDLQQKAPGGHQDRRLGLQTVNEYDAAYDDARDGDHPFNQPSVFTALNLSTRELDGRKVAIPASFRRVVASEDARYALARTMRDVPLEAPISELVPDITDGGDGNLPPGVDFFDAGSGEPKPGATGSITKPQGGVTINGVVVFGDAAKGAAAKALGEGGSAQDALAAALAAAQGRPPPPPLDATTKEREKTPDPPPPPVDLVPLLNKPAGYVIDDNMSIGLLGTVFAPSARAGIFFAPNIGPLPIRHDAQFTAGAEMVGRVVFDPEDVADEDLPHGKIHKGVMAFDSERRDKDTAFAGTETGQWRPAIRVSAALPPSEKPPPPFWSPEEEEELDEKPEDRERKRPKTGPGENSGRPVTGGTDTPGGGVSEGATAGPGDIGIPIPREEEGETGRDGAPEADPETGEPPPVNEPAQQARRYDGPGEPCPNATLGASLEQLNPTLREGIRATAPRIARSSVGVVDMHGHPALTYTPNGVILGGLEQVHYVMPPGEPVELPQLEARRPSADGAQLEPRAEKPTRSQREQVIRNRAARRRQLAEDRYQDGLKRRLDRLRKKAEAFELRGQTGRADVLDKMRAKIKAAEKRRQARRKKREDYRKRKREEHEERMRKRKERAEKRREEREREREQKRQRRAERQDDLEELRERQREDRRARAKRRPPKPPEGGYVLVGGYPDGKVRGWGDLRGQGGTGRELVPLEPEEIDAIRERERKEAEERKRKYGDFWSGRENRAKYGHWNVLTLPLPYFGAHGGPASLEDYTHLSTSTIRGLQRVIKGAFGGPSYLAANVGIVARNRPACAPAGSRIGAHWQSYPGGGDLVIGRGQDVLELISTLDAPAGSSIRAGSGGIVRLIREHIGGGGIIDRRPLLLLENGRGARASHTADVIADTTRRLYVDHTHALAASKLRSYYTPGESGRVLEVAQIHPKTRAVSEPALYVDAADGVLTSPKGAKLAEGAALELEDADKTSTLSISASGEGILAITDPSGTYTPHLTVASLTAAKVTCTSLDPEDVQLDPLASKPAALAASKRGLWWDSNINAMMVWDGTTSRAIPGSSVKRYYPSANTLGPSALSGQVWTWGALGAAAYSQTTITPNGALVTSSAEGSECSLTGATDPGAFSFAVVGSLPDSFRGWSADGIRWRHKLSTITSGSASVVLSVEDGTTSIAAGHRLSITSADTSHQWVTVAGSSLSGLGAGDFFKVTISVTYTGIDAAEALIGRIEMAYD